jgi:hypothetical protein
MDITPKEFAKAVAYAKKASGHPFATLSDIKKMLSCRPMDVMDFIETHPGLVHCEHRHETKAVRVKVRLPGTNKWYWSTDMRNGKSLGLCVIETFETEEDNPWTEKGLQKLIDDNARTVWVSVVDNYGHHIGQALREDKVNDDYRYGGRPQDARKAAWLWRNTRNKLEATKAAGATKDKTFIMGGFMDSYERKEEFSIDEDGIKLLEKDGWTVVKH